LREALNGPQSYYPDGGRKNWADLVPNLDRIIGSVLDLERNSDDPDFVLTDTRRHLYDLREAVVQSGSTGGPEPEGEKGDRDMVKEPPETADRNVINPTEDLRQRLENGPEFGRTGFGRTNPDPSLPAGSNVAVDWSQVPGEPGHANAFAGTRLPPLMSSGATRVRDALADKEMKKIDQAKRSPWPVLKGAHPNVAASSHRATRDLLERAALLAALRDRGAR
jgi:hypothetical protein